MNAKNGGTKLYMIDEDCFTTDTGLDIYMKASRALAYAAADAFNAELSGYAETGMIFDEYAKEMNTLAHLYAKMFMNAAVRRLSEYGEILENGKENTV